jgi:hypothetical protein
METESVVLTSVFIALEGAFAYSAYLPSIMTIGTFVDTPEKIDMIRQGEIVGSVFLVLLAGISSMITKSIMPLIMGLVAGAGTIFIYEKALRNAPAWNVSCDDMIEDNADTF